MKLKVVFKTVQWANFLTLAAQLLNQAGDVVPALKASPWLLLVQGLVGALLPSVGGFAHKVAYGTPQDPDSK